jgi:DNA cross-link repair 1A protein
MREALQEEPETLLVVSSYHIGKERAYLGAAAALGLQVCVVQLSQANSILHHA